MKNKIFLRAFTILTVLLLSLLAFSACQNVDTSSSSEGDEEACAHKWETESAVAPTCNEGGHSVSKCKLCDNRERTYYDPLGHSFTESYEWDFERGIVDATITCSRCDVFYSSNVPKLEEKTIPSTCRSKGKYTLSATFLLNGKEYTDTQEVELPIGECVYNYTYDIKGENCADGYYVNAECIVCGDKKSTTAYTHEKVIETVYDLSDYDTCGGTVTVTSCPCGKYETYSRKNSCGSRNLNYDESGVTYEGDYKYNVESYSCYYCGSKTVTETVSDRETWSQIGTRTTMYSKSGTQIFSVYTYDHSKEKNHTLEYSYENLFFDSCISGYIRIAECNECDFSDKELITSHTHVYEKERISMGEHGMLIISECPCGQNKRHSFETECKNQQGMSISYVPGKPNMHMYVIECEDCNIVCTTEEESVYLEGTYTKLYLKCYTYVTIDGEIVYEKRWEEHNN